MLTKITIRNFKRLRDVQVELGKSVVFVGPNNSGKTTALQALTLWSIGLKLWSVKRGGKASPEKRPGVTINRRDLIAIPVPSASLIWRDLHVRSAARPNGNGKTQTQNVRIDIVVDGISDGRPWSAGLEFDYSSEESLVCRPVRLPGYEDVAVKSAKFTTLPDEALLAEVSYLPPMSGLAAVEPKVEPGRVDVLLGEGQTAQVVRNLCLRIYQSDADHATWERLVTQIQRSFGITLLPPEYIGARGEIIMQYDESPRTRLDLSSAGRGLQQTLLLLAHLYANPGRILLLDEPDAHLEILRQRQIYNLITDLADSQGSQIIAASHSEVVLNEAVNRGMVIAFVGQPHRILDRGSQVSKALTTIGFEQFYQAEQTGWILYVEDSTDLSILQAFARRLDHPAAKILEQPFVHYVATNVPQLARDHFYGLREGKPDLVGVALFDRLDKQLKPNDAIDEVMWEKREIENYLVTPEVLLAFAKHDVADDLFGIAEAEKRMKAMRESIDEVTTALQTLGRPGPWTADIKVTDDFLEPLFKAFFSKLKLPLSFRKSDYYQLARFIGKEKLDQEVNAKLNAIVAVASRAKPRLD